MGRRKVRHECINVRTGPELFARAFEVWRAQARLGKANRACRAATKSAREARLALLWQELDVAWRARKLAQAWAIARRVAGVAKGSRRRLGKVPLLSRPTCKQFEDKYALDPREGGWGAVKVGLDQ
eukprot:11176966-Lingulodinium_polyedra.AAC.1